MKKILFLFAMMLAVGTVSATIKTYATFGTPGSSASYNAETFTYSCTANNNNLMNCFSFSNGELVNYSTLNFTFSGLGDGESVRINVLFRDGTNNSKQYASNGTKSTSLTELLSGTKTLADITAIRFGGYSSSVSACVVKASDMYLESDGNNMQAAHFATPASNASYADFTYTWTGSTSNLMNCFTFASGELANYDKLVFSFFDLSDGASVRINVLYSDGNKSKEYYTEGKDKETNVSELLPDGKTAADITAIRFGGNSGTGSTKVANMYLVNSTTGARLYATYGTPGGNATLSGLNAYAWTGSTSNLMDVFTFSNGELANYTTLTFTFSDLVDGPVRAGYYVGNSFTEFGSGYYSAGTKTVDLCALGIDLSTVTKLVFGGKSNGGSCTINPEQVVLSNDALNRGFIVGQKCTVCLPFALTASEVSAAGTFYTLSSVDGTTLTFSPVSTTEAYKPYVFEPASAQPFVNLNKTCESSSGQLCETTVGGYTFKGVLATGKVPKDAYGYNDKNGTFVKATSANVNINAFRAYIKASSSARELSINLGGATGISEAKKAQSTDGAIYNLNGQRVSADYKGVVIKNGKKVVMK